MGEIDKRSERLWAELEELIESLPQDELESGEPRPAADGGDFADEPLDDHEQFLAESYLYGRLRHQGARRLRNYVELRDLGKLQDIWGEMAANASYWDEPMSTAVQERGEAIIDHLQALATRQKILTAARSEGGAKVSEITLELVDPLLLDLLAKRPELLQSLEWRTFEKLLARVLEDLGYEIELQQGTKDGGVDIFALKRDTVFGAHRYLLQAKRWSQAVGVEPVRELLFLHGHHRITRSCLATTSRFTKGAWELARDYAWQLELKDFDRLLEWVRLSRAAKSRPPR